MSDANVKTTPMRVRCNVCGKAKELNLPAGEYVAFKCRRCSQWLIVDDLPGDGVVISRATTELLRMLEVFGAE
jgi:hypothetical protein